MAWYDSLLGNPGNTSQINRVAPQFQGGINELFSQTLQGLQNPNPGTGFQPIAQQARNQFQQQTVPGLAERFTSMGGGQRSSAFQGALGSAASGLEQGLASQQAQFGQNQQSQLQNLLSTLLSTSEPLYTQRQPGALESAIPGALQALITYLSGGTGGLASGAIGGLGQLLGSGLGQTQQANQSSVFGNSGIQNLLRGY